jgi:hypothetical protein
MAQKTATALMAVAMLFLLSASVTALSLGPARVEWVFKPGLEGHFDLTVTENTGKPVDIVMYAEGELSPYVTITPTNFHLDARQSKGVTYSFKLPESFSGYGRKEALIIAKESIDRTRTGQIGAVVAIGHQFWVHVPYPYRYAEATIQAENIALDLVRQKQPAFFDVRISNLGSEDLDTELSFELRAPNGEIVKRFDPRVIALAKGESKVAEFDWIADDPTALEGGVYLAQAHLAFDGNAPTDAQAEFKIGDEQVDATALTPSPFFLGEIARLEVTLDSLWGNALEDVYAQGILLNESGTVIRNTVPSQSVEILPWGTRTVELFLDTKDLEAKTYDFNVSVRFGSKTTSKVFRLDVREKPLTEGTGTVSAPDSGLLLIGGALIALLVLVIVGMGFLLVKKKKGL